MDSTELQKIAERARFMREAGLALIITSALLAVFLFLPLGSKPGSQTSDTDSRSLTSATSTPDAFASVPITAKAAIVYDLATGKELYTKNADAQLPLASLTKLLTVYVALKEFPPSAPISIPAEATRLDAPHAFKAGDTLPLADLARLTLVASLNDGATAIAEAAAAHQGQSSSTMLASAAAGLGLAETYAVNGSGLDVNASVSGGYGSAHDLARLAGALVAEAPAVALATTERTAQASSLSGTSFTVKNTDPIIGTIPNLLLSKTGYTDLAGGNLALVFDVGLGHPIAVVVLGSTKNARFTDASALVAATLAHFAGVASL